MKTRYKKIILSTSAQADPLLGGPEVRGYVKSSTARIPSFLAIPAMVVGALVGTVVFSAFFALLLIPMGIFAFKAWRTFGKLRQHATATDSLEAEYRVIEDEDVPRR